GPWSDEGRADEWERPADAAGLAWLLSGLGRAPVLAASATPPAPTTTAVIAAALTVSSLTSVVLIIGCLRGGGTGCSLAAPNPATASCRPVSSAGRAGPAEAASTAASSWCWSSTRSPPPPPARRRSAVAAVMRRVRRLLISSVPAPGPG